MKSCTAQPCVEAGPGRQGGQCGPLQCDIVTSGAWTQHGLCSLHHSHQTHNWSHCGEHSPPMWILHTVTVSLRVTLGTDHSPINHAVMHGSCHWPHLMMETTPSPATAPAILKPSETFFLLQCFYVDTAMMVILNLFPQSGQILAYILPMSKFYKQQILSIIVDSEHAIVQPYWYWRTRNCIF